MTMTSIEYPVAPVAEKPKGTLLDTVQVGTEEQFRVHDGLDLFASYNCLRFDAEAEFCAPNTKTFDQSGGWIDGFRFAVYGGVSCKSIGLDQAEQEAAVQRAFETGESTAVERALMRQRFAESDFDGETDGARWDAPEDINPTGAVKPAVGIALLEEFAGDAYVGVPTLHVPLTVASLVLGVDGAVFSGNQIRTKFGSKMVAGRGYAFPNLGPDGTPAADGERWIYATGEVWVAPGPLVVRQVMDPSTNEVVALGERGYIAAVDCFTAAIRVNIEG